MKSIDKIIYIFFIGMFISGCSSWRIEIIDSTNPLQPQFSLVRGSGPMPRLIYVSEEGQKDMWHFVFIEDNNKPSYRFTYGVITEGMREEIKAKTLEKDVLYFVAGRAGHYGTDLLYFTIVEKNGKLVLEEVEGERAKSMLRADQPARAQ